MAENNIHKCEHCKHSSPTWGPLPGTESETHVKCNVQLPTWIAERGFSERGVRKEATCMFWEAKRTEK